MYHVPTRDHLSVPHHHGRQVPATDPNEPSLTRWPLCRTRGTTNTGGRFVDVYEQIEDDGERKRRIEEELRLEKYVYSPGLGVNMNYVQEIEESIESFCKIPT
uniref:Uncharacterized protein n=1 Tax=Cacopsylla melanoneura TaxID=428564 RepID=A0A8D8ZE50_9HEMI